MYPGTYTMQYCRYTAMTNLYLSYQPNTRAETEATGMIDIIGWAPLVWSEQRRDGMREKHPSADTQNRYSGKYFVQRIEFFSRICFCFLSSYFSGKLPFPPGFILPGVKIYRNWPKLYDVGGLGGASTARFTNQNLVRFTAADWVIN